MLAMFLFYYTCFMVEIAPEQPVGREEDTWSFRIIFFEMLKTFLLAVAIIIPIRIFFFQPFFVEGASMEPSFHNGEYLLIGEQGYKQVQLGGFTLKPSKELKRGFIAVFHPPRHESQYYIKRVIGLPGESIEIKNNHVVIYNGEFPQGSVLEEPYIARNAIMEDMPKLKLSSDQYFMMGDNRMFSFDSRSFGPVSKDELVGRVLLRAWPAGEFTVF
jgi:signal peptidase I